MYRESPEIDVRQAEELVQEFKSLIPFYTSEWRPDDGTAGLALVRIFSRMLEILIQRLNQVPRKHFITFLNELGLTSLPAEPARVPVMFSLAGGTPRHVFIPERTQIGAGDVVFETEQHILAAPSRLIKTYSLDVTNDGIYESPPHIISGKPVASLQTKLQYDVKQGETDIFIQRSEELQAGDVVNIGRIEHGVVAAVADSKITLLHKLEHGHNANDGVEKVTHFELFEGKNLQEHVLYLGHEDMFTLKSHVQLTLTCSPGDSMLSELRTLMWEYWGERPVDEGKETKISDWYQFNNVTINDNRLILKKQNQDEMTAREVNGIKTRWIRCRVPAFQISRFQNIEIGMIGVTVNADNEPDMMFYNDVPLDLTLDNQGNFKNALYPFGKQPRLYDTFYIASSEVFSKKGAKITFIVTPPANEIKPIPSSDLELSWEYWNGKGWVVIGNVNDSTDNFSFSSNSNTIVFTCPTNIDKATVNGQENYWIRGRIVHGDYGKVEFVEKTAFKITDQVLSSLQKQGISVEIINKLHSLKTQEGKTKEQFLALLKETLGDAVTAEYGTLLLQSAEQKIWRPDFSQIHPPKFQKLTITYQPDGQNVQSCLAYNNLEFRDHTDESKTAGKRFKPFIPPDDLYQTLYLGFDQKLEKGPVSIFFSIEEQAWSVDVPPGIEWEYYTGSGKWTRLDIIDETGGLVRSGTIQYVFPQNVKKTQKFGKELYWIRAVDKKNVFVPIKKAYADLFQIFPPLTFNNLPWSKFVLEDYVIPGLIIYEPTFNVPEINVNMFDIIVRPLSVSRGRAIPESQSSSEISPCRQVLELSHPEWQHPEQVKKYAISPRIKGIYLNTAWAVQTESVKDEILGSSDGTAGQKFSLLRNPVFTEQIWVNEFKTLSQQDKTQLVKAGKYQTRETQDSQGNTTEFWVKWKSVEDLVASLKEDRHYTIDKVSGEITFGDGVHGRIPSIGTNNIHADYQIGGGSQGNVPEYEVKDLKSSLPFVEKAFNPLAASGGTDVESVEKAVERGAYVLKHRNRSITSEDFEQLLYKASRAIARVKCLPHIDNQGGVNPGWVTVLIVPQSHETRPKLSLQLKRSVENYLKEHSANTIIEKNHFQVSEPLYVEASVSTTLIAISPERIPLIETNAFTRLRAFLHPFTGGYQGQGWDFGRLPCFSDFYALLEKIEGVDHVEQLSLRLRTYAEGAIHSEFFLHPEQRTNIELPPYAIIYSGEHTVTITIETSTGGE